MMNKEEQIVEVFLRSKATRIPQYEPNGKSTFPDFLVLANIAVEVRRLDENFFPSQGSPSPLSREDYGLKRRLKDAIIRQFSYPTRDVTHWLFLDCKRPLGNKKQIVKDVLRGLNNPISIEQPSAIDINTGGIQVKFGISTHWVDSLFMIGSSHDDDSGGFMDEIYMSNIQFCVDEKDNISRKCPQKYNKYWLILVDSMPYNSQNVPRILPSINNKIFDKIYVLDKNGREKGMSE